MLATGADCTTKATKVSSKLRRRLAIFLQLLFDHLSVSRPGPNAALGDIQPAVTMAALWVAAMWYDRVEFQAEMAKKPRDERRGRFKLRIGRRKPGIILAKLAWRPGYVFDTHRLTVSPAVMPGPVARVHELHHVSRLTHDKVGRRLRLGLLEARYAAVSTWLAVCDVYHDQPHRLAPPAAVVRRGRPESAGVLRGQSLTGLAV